MNVRFVSTVCAFIVAAFPVALLAQTPPEPAKGPATVPTPYHDFQRPGPVESAAASGAFTFTVPLQLTTVGIGTATGHVPRVSVECAVVSGTGVRFTLLQSQFGEIVGFASEPTAEGSPGAVVAKGASQPVRLDSTGSFNGSTTVAANLIGNERAASGHAWACVLLFDGSRPVNARPARGDTPYVASSFRVTARGTLK